MLILGYFFMVDLVSLYFERLDLWQEFCLKVSIVGMYVQLFKVF